MSTEQSGETGSEQSLVPTLDKDTRDRVNEALRGVTKVADLDKFLERIASAGVQRFDKPPVSVPEITQQHLDALARLPEIYGKVVPKSDRALNASELATIAEERQTIDLVLKLLEARKSDSIRETLANHLDHVYYRAHPGEEPPTDKRGHVAVKGATENDALVRGGKYKVARTVSGGKKVLTLSEVEVLRHDGKISAEVYERITRVIPPSSMPVTVLDEEGLVAAMKSDPGLAFTLAQAARTTDTTTSITIKEV